MDSPVDIPARVRAAYERLAEAGRPDIWITLREADDVLTEAKSLAERVLDGEPLPLAGALVAVADTVDVAGLPTTAACPAYAYRPEASAPAVARLAAAGALVLGKANLDQFAAGLPGSRSPYGTVGAAHDPRRVSGAVSCGAAVAVALGIADIGLATHSAGAGRVAAAFNGLVAFTPTRGLVPLSGVVPACRSYDRVIVLARNLTEGQRAAAVMTGPEPADPRSRTWPTYARLAAGDAPAVAVPDPRALQALSEAGRTTFSDTVDTLRGGGARIVEVDALPLLAAGRLLHEGALVAERYAALGAFVDAHPGEVDPVVGAIIGRASAVPAHRLVADLDRLDGHRAAAAAVFAAADALLLPTAPPQPTVAAAMADPVGTNAVLGTYAGIANLLDLSAVAVPAGTADGNPFGVTVLAPTFADQVAIDVAARLTGEQAPDPYPDTGTDLVVFGPHLRGEPLHPRLAALGARYRGPVRTAPRYRMVLVAGSVAHAGVVHDPAQGVSLPGERWTLSPAALGAFLTALPPPLTLGPVALAAGGSAVGIGCEAGAAATAEDITAYGGWRAYVHRGGELPGAGR